MTNFYYLSTGSTCYSNIVLKSLPSDLNNPYVAHFNACSMFNKLADINRKVLNSNLHVIFVTETWLNFTDHYNSINISGYTSYRHDRAGLRGVVFLFMLKNV